MRKSSALPAFVVIVCILAAMPLAAAQLRIQSQSLPSPICLGVHNTVSIFAQDIPRPVSSFRLALGLAESSQTFVGVMPGNFMNACGWEYLTWKIDRTTPIAATPPTSTRVSAILEINAVAAVSSGHAITCSQITGEQELVKVEFLLAPSMKHINEGCSFVPIRFYWRDCRDNSFVVSGSDTIMVADNVTDSGGSSGPNPIGFTFPGFGPPGVLCLGSGSHVMTGLSAQNGGIDLACTDETICLRGDLNANGIPSEVGDAVTYGDYFERGLVAFEPHIQYSIVASDVDGDGTTLSLGDFVYLLRIVASDIH